MQLNQARISRYLKKLQHVNNYILKLETKSREELILLMKARGDLLEGEQRLRKLNEYLVTGEK